MERIAELGAICGRPDTIRLGVEANENPPRLRTHDRFGNRIDEVEFHPAWHELMRLGISHGLHAAPWLEPQPGAHVARARVVHAAAQVEAGVGCPISMTYSAIPALRMQPELAAEWEPRFLSLDYDRAARARARQGRRAVRHGDDREAGRLRRARQHDDRAPLNGGGPGAEYEISGHKWFFSAPMCDAFLVLAQADGGLSCFLMPRLTPDGERNAIHLQRLKDKLGNRSNASSEVEFRCAWARHGRRGGPRRADDHRDGQPHPARLRLGSATGMRCGHRAGDSSRRATARPSASCSSTSR